MNSGFLFQNFIYFLIIQKKNISIKRKGFMDLKKKKENVLFVVKIIFLNYGPLKNKSVIIILT